MTRLRIVAVEKHWGTASGLHPVSFEAEAGMVVALRGRSGSGKSTLVAVIAGWCAADRGEVRIDDAVVPRDPPWGLVAVVPQVLGLPPELSLRETVAEAARGATVEEVDALLGSLDLGAIARRPPDLVSMGQRQRAAVARAAVAVPAVMLADEPTSHQDTHHVEMVTDALLAVAARGSCVVVASHDPHVVERAHLVVDLTA